MKTNTALRVRRRGELKLDPDRIATIQLCEDLGITADNWDEIHGPHGFRRQKDVDLYVEELAFTMHGHDRDYWPESVKNYLRTTI